jgi:8-oxo-dGTP diphosphatase
MKPRSFKDIDWSRWQAKECATLLFVLRGRRILLIHKKKGLGAGKLNGPGGRLEPGETPRRAAIREVREELRITPTGVKPVGELLFQFVDGHSIHGYVFTATGCRGTPRETDEAIPVWASVNALPYHRMWADDRVWMPLVLAGRPFVGRFLFDGDQMLGCDMDTDKG